MTDDIIDEELQIAKEQDQAEQKQLNAKIFELPGYRSRKFLTLTF